MSTFTHIKTTTDNRVRVSELTRKLSLGPENVIARIALGYSIAQGRKLDVSEIGNSGGKEYSKNVLFGQYLPYYIALISNHYQLYKSDKDIAKYIKMHIDDGLELIDEEIKANPNIEGFDFLIRLIDNGLKKIL